MYNINRFKFVVPSKETKLDFFSKFSIFLIKNQYHKIEIIIIIIIVIIIIIIIRIIIRIIIIIIIMIIIRK